MKITQKSMQTNAGAHFKCNKSKKNKGVRRISEKTLKDLNLSDSPEKFKTSKENKKNRNRQSQSEDFTNVKIDLKRNQLEKRKQDCCEWKSLKKTDCGRLETVLEEGQLCDDYEAKFTSPKESNKNDCNVDTDQAKDFSHCRKRKSRIYELVAISEQPEFWKKEETKAQGQSNGEKYDAEKDEKSQYVDRTEKEKREIEDKSVPSKRNMNLSGIMEIFPIFSNDKFVCSRDDISIEEYEELEHQENRGSSTDKTNPKCDISKKELSICHPEESLADTIRGSKDPNERKLHYKMLTDPTLGQKSSSHFINSLLILTPFAAEREKLFRERKQSNKRCIETNFHLKDHFPINIQEIEGDSPLQIMNPGIMNLRQFSQFTASTMVLLSINIS